MGLKKFIGDKKFYKFLLSVALPIVIQNGITNFVSLLDNIMVGRVGTEQMSGVSIGNQLLFVFMLCTFGAISGPGIFTAQFHGSGNANGVRHTFRFKLIVSLIISVIAISVLFFFDDRLISLFLHDSGSTGDLGLTLIYGKQYMQVMLIGLIPFAIMQCYSSTLRETGETVVPMKAGVSAVLVNLFFNYLLIYGHLGFPKLGVVGAAIATVISRFVELFIVAFWTHRHKDKNLFIVGAYKSIHIPGSLVKSMCVKGAPLMANETLWSVGMSLITQCYSMRGLAAIAALNITSTLSNLFNVVAMSMGNAVAIIVGNLLGSYKMDEARDTDTKLIFTSTVSCVVIGVLMFIVAPLFPELYNTNDEVRELATGLLRITALFMPVLAFLHSCYFTLRSGGKTLITFAFDCVFTWVVCVPPSYIISRFTGLPIIPFYTVIHCLDFIKVILGFILVKKGVWIHNIVTEHPQSGG